ncbi:polysaccharide deacetylase family protein [Paenibacillus herberti]|uniref:Polysaccharide deacetylase n=1 Tax=Paenibacillus herberti TaxID=1619309 RepID=A0A229NVS2_9BACL|nr:polysaccharide deacetylase family protein [Paenibacillus herberti]OXM13961.1 polysaccharide deacetylase [Paenibacillus herberti]
MITEHNPSSDSGPNKSNSNSISNIHTMAGRFAKPFLILPLAIVLTAAASGCGQAELAGKVEAGGFNVVQSENGATGKAQSSNEPIAVQPPTSPQSTKNPADVSNAKKGIVKRGDKVVALTFDDGPDPKTTVKILDILKRENIKATFFVVGVQVEQYPEIMKRIVDEGHLIGNHSNNHANLGKSSRSKIKQQIEDNDKLIKEAVGFTTNFFRPAYGASSSQLRAYLKNTGRKQVLWDVDTRDWAGTSVKDMRANVNQNTKPGSNILMHSFGSKLKTPELLPLIIDDLRDKGYSFVTVDKLP